MPITKARTETQMGKRLDSLLARTLPRGSAGVAICHTPDPGSDAAGSARNAIAWRGFGGPLEGRLAMVAFLREMADTLERGSGN